MIKPNGNRVGENPTQLPTVIFLHIPRTAGTTLHRIIERQYRPEEIYSMKGGDAHAAVREFKALSEESRAEIRMLKGHVALGLHESVPNPSVYLTILRDPIERVISYYYFILRAPDHYLYDTITSENMSLQTCLEREIPIMMNDAQVRLLSGVWGDLGFGQCDRDVLGMAKKNLCEHFAMIGLTERFDETLCLMRKALGWQNSILYTRLNATRNRPKQQSFSPEALHVIAQANQLDIELYQYAQNLFEEQLRRQGPSFGLEVKAFQIHNGLDRFYHTQLERLYWEFRKISVRMFIRKWFQRLLH
jgi:hypothetical protein